MIILSVSVQNKLKGFESILSLTERKDSCNQATSMIVMYCLFLLTEMIFIPISNLFWYKLNELQKARRTSGKSTLVPLWSIMAFCGFVWYAHIRDVFRNQLNI